MTNTLGFETWVAPRHLDGGWLPSMFEPRVMGLIQSVENSRTNVASLEELCVVVGEIRDDLDPVFCRWFIESRGIRRSRVSDFASRAETLRVLPDEALLIPKMFSGEPSFQYWNSNIYRGTGCYDETKFVALEANKGGSTAWLSEAIGSDYASAQIRRLTQGSTIPFLSQTQILDLRVELPEAEAQSASAKLAKRKATAIAEAQAASRIKKNVFLSGQTHEERLTQFEQFVLDEGIFSREDFFYIEPANRGKLDSDLFVASSRLGENKQRLKDRNFGFVEEPEVAEAWRDWFWGSSNQEEYRVFNSLVGGRQLPGYIVVNSFLPPNHVELIPDDGFQRIIPSFSSFREITNGQNPEAARSELTNEWADVWCSLNEVDSEAIQQSLSSDIGGKFVEAVFHWACFVFRPALVSKVQKEGETVGAYVFFGDSDVSNAESSFETLDDLGFQFSQILSPSSESVESATKRESLRRLSWLMHQLNGPIGRARTAFKDLEEFLSHNPEVSAALVPSEAKARRRAEMHDPDSPSVTDHTFAARLNSAVKAVNDIRSVSYQIKRLKRVQGDLAKSSFDISVLLERIRKETSQRMDNLEVTVETQSGLEAFGEEQSIREALEEVVSNACRELQTRKVSNPRIILSASQRDAKTIVKVTDNALPATESIAVTDPFKEDSSSYSKDGKGTGLGLAIVRDTFRAHNGTCTLDVNSSNGQRTAGVTFLATMELKNA